MVTPEKAEACWLQFSLGIATAYCSGLNSAMAGMN